MSKLPLEGIRSLLVSSFENCDVQKAQELVDRYATIPTSPKNVCLEKDQGEREQGFLIRHIMHLESSGIQFLLINDLADFQNPNSCLIITYDVDTKRVMGYRKCSYALYFVSTVSQKELIIRYHATFSKSNQLHKIVSRPIFYVILFLLQRILFSNSMTYYVIPPQELYPLKIPPKLLNSIQLGFLLSEELPEENGLSKKSHTHTVVCETYAYQIAKCLIGYATFGIITSLIMSFLWRSLITLF